MKNKNKAKDVKKIIAVSLLATAGSAVLISGLGALTITLALRNLYDDVEIH